jgi:hypothetical protein
MKILNLRWLGLLILFLRVSAYGVNPPPFPTEFFQFFPTNYITDYGSVPATYTTNLVTTNVTIGPFYGDVLILDTTNLNPASLAYFVQDTNWISNIAFDTGDLFFLFEPNWSSVSQGGTGPGATAGAVSYLIAGGDWTSGSPNGLFRIYIDAAGSNIFFGGIKTGVTNTYASAPISWSSNSWHEIGVSYSVHPSQSKIYLDGGLAATGTAVSYVPVLSTNSLGFYTNTFYIGSDNTGYAQARGAFYNLDTWSGQVYGGYYTNDWLDFSNSMAAWQSGFGGGFFGGMFSPIGGLLTSDGTCTNCTTGSGVMFTDMLAMRDTNGDGGTTFIFSITDGGPGTNYDVIATTALWTNNMTNSVWTWLGQGTNGGTYAATNQPASRQFYILAGTVTNDGSGLTVAYENLVSHGATKDSFGTPYLWYMAQGMNPLTGGLATLDPDFDGLLNYQEYLYGTRPQVSEGFAVWVAEPNGTSGIP